MNKRKYFIPVIFLTAFLFSISFSSNNYSHDITLFQYVGVKKCAVVCHKGDSKGNQLEIWQGSKHSQAWKTLETEEANNITKEKNFETPAIETPECVRCHVFEKDVSPDELTESFDKTQGVQCESCHGPGSDYKKLSIMKDRDKAIENGLVIHDEKEAFCTQCHNSESPTFESFNYDEMWEQIKHPIPSK